MTTAPLTPETLATMRATALASDDGTEHEHNGHAEHEGEPECPGCWAADLYRLLDGEGES